jgi:hypothetical protein
MAHWSHSGTQLAAADIELDASESWTLGITGISLFSVLAHEIGHAVGVAHSDAELGVMNACNSNLQALRAPNIGAVQATSRCRAPATSMAPATRSPTPSSAMPGTTS